jgi:hypothetical protein
VGRTQMARHAAIDWIPLSVEESDRTSWIPSPFRAVSARCALTQGPPNTTTKIGAVERRPNARGLSMNPYNHYAYGAVADWIYRYAAGIDTLPAGAGFHHPNFDDRLGSLDFRYQSSYGEIRSAWDMKGVGVTWLVTILPNTTAHLPLRQASRISSPLTGSGWQPSRKNVC